MYTIIIIMLVYSVSTTSIACDLDNRVSTSIIVFWLLVTKATAGFLKGESQTNKTLCLSADDGFRVKVKVQSV